MRRNALMQGVMHRMCDAQLPYSGITRDLMLKPYSGYTEYVNLDLSLVWSQPYSRINGHHVAHVPDKFWGMNNVAEHGTERPGANRRFDNATRPYAAHRKQRPERARRTGEYR